MMADSQNTKPRRGLTTKIVEIFTTSQLSILFLIISLLAGAAALTLTAREEDPLRIADRPLQRLHGPQASSHHCGETRDAQGVGQPRLRVDPVLDGDHWKRGAEWRAGLGVDAGGAG